MAKGAKGALMLSRVERVAPCAKAARMMSRLDAVAQGGKGGADDVEVVVVSELAGREGDWWGRFERGR